MPRGHGVRDRTLGPHRRSGELCGNNPFIPHACLEALDAAEFQRVYDVNLIGAFQLTRACEAAQRAAGDAAVINVSSIAGLRGTASSLAYAASKGALNTMTLSLARSLTPLVRVNAIARGFVDGSLPQRVVGRRTLRHPGAGADRRRHAEPRLAAGGNRGDGVVHFKSAQREMK